MSGVDHIAVKSANNLFLNTLSPNGHVSIMAKYLLIRKSGTYTCQRTRGSAHPHLHPCASVSAPMRIRFSSHAHPFQFPCASASAPIRIRICSHVRLRLPPCSPNLLFLESALLMAVLLTTNRNCGGLRDENDGLENKKTGFTVIYRCKKSYCGKILISLPII